MVLTLYSSTAGMFKLPIVSPWTVLAASSQVHCAGDTNCSHRTNLSVGPSQFLNQAGLPALRSPASGSLQSSQPCRYFEGLSRASLQALNPVLWQSFLSQPLCNSCRYQSATQSYAVAYRLIRNVFLIKPCTFKYSNSYQILIQQDAISCMTELRLK